MPGGDRTGPRGGGPGTGWGQGGCVPRGQGGGFGRGFGFGRGRGRGRGFGFGRAFGAVGNFFAPYSAEEEVKGLRAEREAIDARILELEKEKN
ncbi:MAG: DUF5320 family protein [Candidatus Margulisiibacteriota bacterium]